ncbi:hypothetical protein B0H10DRAFT_907330 [Mycena sp. CBHHK59/15]|nr:hypothetical protein B0H10DRAFT_907330 [Mycena sp. CBHHK59/15]
MQSRQHGLMFLVFEQGISSTSLYFSVISIFTTTAVIFNYARCQIRYCESPHSISNLARAAGLLAMPTYTLPLSCILTARFLLHLREYDASLLTAEQSEALARKSLEGHRRGLWRRSCGPPALDGSREWGLRGERARVVDRGSKISICLEGVRRQTRVAVLRLKKGL